MHSKKYINNMIEKDIDYIKKAKELLNKSKENNDKINSHKLSKNKLYEHNKHLQTKFDKIMNN